MKKNYFTCIFIIFGLLSIISCKKEEDPLPDQKYLDIMSGEWAIESIRFEVNGEDSILLNPEGSFSFNHCDIREHGIGTCQGTYEFNGTEPIGFAFDVNSTANSVIFSLFQGENDPLGLHVSYFEFFGLGINEIILEGDTSVDGGFRNRPTTIVLQKVR